jgi:hypothetical protein
MAWTRNTRRVQELVIASDSRLTSPFKWDCCPKIIPLGRGDSAICFAGATYLAYPMILQMQNTLRMHPTALSRVMDLYDLKSRLLRVMNEMRSGATDFPSDREAVGERETLFILTGYSWRKKAFVIWTLHLQPDIDKFTFRRVTPWGGVRGHRLLAVVGDQRKEAMIRLRAALFANGKKITGGFDMEPLGVLRDMIRENVDPAIGGPPQVVKVYRHMNTSHFGVFWPNRASGSITVFGRRLLANEPPNCGVYDPDTFDVIPALEARVPERDKNLRH